MKNKDQFNWKIHEYILLLIICMMTAMLTSCGWLSDEPTKVEDTELQVTEETRTDESILTPLQPDIDVANTDSDNETNTSKDNETNTFKREEFDTVTTKSTEISNSKKDITNLHDVGNSSTNTSPTSSEKPSVKVMYIINFQTNGGGVVESQSIEKGKSVARPADPTKEGFVFAGWYSDEALTSEYSFETKVNANITLYAKWKLMTYKVQFQTNGGGVVESQLIERGKSATRPADPTKEGFIFAGWYSDEALTSEYSFETKVNANITLYAKWQSVSSEQKTIQLRVSDTEISIGEEGKVYFYAEIDSNVEKVSLVDELTGEIILELLDDGKYSISGDDLQNDNIYSGKIVINTSKESKTTYYAIAGENSEYISNKIQIEVLGGFSETQLTEMEIVENTFNEQIFDNDTFKEMSITERKNLAESVLDDLSEQEYIDEDTILCDDENSTYTFMYESGALGALILEDWSSDYDGMIDETMELTDETTESNREARVAASLSISDEIATIADSDENGKQMVNLGEAIVLWSFEQAWDDSNFRVPFYEQLKTDFDALGLETTVDWDTTVEDYKNLENYEVIMFSGHGSFTDYKIKTGWFSSETRTLPSLLLFEKSTKEKDKLYENDLKQFRVGKISVQGGTMYAILPDFFNDYYDSGDLDGSFIFIQDCESHGKDGNENLLFSQSLRNASAEAVVGYHNSVRSNYGRNLMKTYILSLIEGKTAKGAFDDAVNKHGATDGDIAYPIFSGNEDAVLVQDGIRNGCFELATTPISWEQIGDTRVISKLSSLLPTEGQRMGILTTGIGSAEEDYLAGTEGSVLSQTFRIPDGAKTLSFDYDVVSEEPMEYVGSNYNDTFVVKLTVGTEVYTIVTEDINSSTWYEIKGIDFEGGDSTTYHTQWKNVEYDVSGHAGKIVNLQFIVYDVGDSIYDTAALIDSIVLH